MTFTAKNSRFNREANLLGKIIFLIENVNGLSYFAVLNNNENIIYCFCENNLFEKEFTISENADIPYAKLNGIKQALDIDKSAILRYPIDLKRLNIK